MRILIVLTYYRPHTSGLTIYTERLAGALVKRGHEVTVFTTQFDKKLPLEEVVDGVKVIRSKVSNADQQGSHFTCIRLSGNKAGEETQM